MLSSLLLLLLLSILFQETKGSPTIGSPGPWKLANPTHQTVIREYFSANPAIKSRKFDLDGGGAVKALNFGSGKIVVIPADQKIAGRGTFGKVKYGYVLGESNQLGPVVVKRVINEDPKHVSGETYRATTPKDFELEASRLKLIDLQHPLFTEPLQINHNSGPKKQYQVQRHVEGVQLTEYMKLATTGKEQIQSMKHVEEALQRLHQKGLVHGDPHLENVFFDPKTTRGYLIDLGKAKEIGVHRDANPSNDIFGFYRDVLNFNAKNQGVLRPESIAFAEQRLVQLSMQPPKVAQAQPGTKKDTASLSFEDRVKNLEDRLAKAVFE